MKLSVLYELATPYPYDPDRERQIFQEALEQIELCDRLGFQTVWAVEHHFLEQYAHCSSPEVFLAACSQRTKQMRLGHGIMQAVPKINHPFRVAERIATLDLISNGRVDFGSGEGASEGELGGFGVDIATKREEWEEGLDFAIKAMTEMPFAGYDGKYVSAPPRNVVPKPFQRPHPPLWMATSRRDSIGRAARKGLGALGFFFVDMDVAREWVEFYFRTFEEEAVPVGLAANPNFVLNIPLAAAPTRKQAQERFQLSVDFFTEASVHYYRKGEHHPGRTNVFQDFLDARAAEQPELQGGPVGTVEDIIATIKPYADMGVDQILAMPQVGFSATHEDIMESIELIGREVIPELHRQHELDEPKREKWKNQLREKAMARKPYEEPRQVPEEYYFGVAESGMKAGLDELFATIEGGGHESRPADWAATTD